MISGQITFSFGVVTPMGVSTTIKIGRIVFSIPVDSEVNVSPDHVMVYEAISGGTTTVIGT